MSDDRLDDLKAARDYLFDMYDQTEREELKLALRLVNREIRRLGPDQGGESRAETTHEAPAANDARSWSRADDEFLRRKLANPTQTKDEAKRILLECSEHLRRTDAETYSRIRTLQLHSNLHAWGNKPKVQWRTMQPSGNDAALPGLQTSRYPEHDS